LHEGSVSIRVAERHLYADLLPRRLGSVKYLCPVVITNCTMGAAVFQMFLDNGVDGGVSEAFLLLDPFASGNSY